MKGSCVWLVVRVGARNFHIECGPLGGRGVPYVYIYIDVYPCAYIHMYLYTQCSSALSAVSHLGPHSHGGKQDSSYRGS